MLALHSHAMGILTPLPTKHLAATHTRNCPAPQRTLNTRSSGTPSLPAFLFSHPANSSCDTCAWARSSSTAVVAQQALAPAWQRW